MSLRRSRHYKKLLLIVLPLAALLGMGGGSYALFFAGSAQPGDGDTAVNLQKGLVGHWKLDNNFKNSTPYGGDGTATGGMTPTADRGGKTDSAMSFNGSSYVTIPDQDAWSPSAITMSAWVYPTSGNTGNFMSKNGNQEWRFRVTSNYHVQILDEPLSGGSSLSSIQAIPASQWSLVTITGDSSGLAIYINGQLDTSNSTPYLSTNTAGALYVGTFLGTNEFFTGSLDDLRIYNRVINPSEAKALYDSYDSAVHLGNLQTGLIGHWKLDGNAKDSSPHAYDGTSGGTTPVADREGSSGAAMSFTGDSSSYIQITNFDNTVLTPSHFNATWTMSIWAKSGTNANERVLLGKQGCNGGIYTYNGKYVFAIKGSACWTGAQTIYGSALDANWHLLTATYSAGAMAFYEDGVLQGTATLANMNNYGNDLGIGNTNGGHGYGFNGALDDARIYNRVLSASEIQQLYDSYNSQINLGGGSSSSPLNLAKGLVGYWPFNGNAKDATPYANNGTVSGATLAADRFGKADSAYQLGNANAYISIGTPSIFSGLTSSGFTYSIWLMRQDDSTYHWPEIMGSSNTHVYYGVRSGNYGDGIYFEYGKSPYDGSSFAATTSNSLPVGQWHMYTVTYDGSTLNTYWDGVSKTSTGAALNPAPFGFLFSNSSADWNGVIDDARVYSRPLTTAEIQALYNLQS